MRFALPFLIALAACSTSEQPRSTTVSAEEAKSLLIDRNWLDRMPETERDHLFVYRFVPDMGGGVFQDRTLYKGTFELFSFKSDGTTIKFDLHETKTVVTSKYTIEKVDGPKPFDLKLTIPDDPRGPNVYFGMRAETAIAPVRHSSSDSVRTSSFVTLALIVGASCTPIAHADRRSRKLDNPGFTATVGLGSNVEDPYLEFQLGRRFARAPWFELYLDYSYNWPISEFSFQTFGIGTRTTILRRRQASLFHQSLLAFAVSSSGEGPVQDRALGERLLGAFMTQGIGTAMQLSPRWTMSLVISTGYPVWLRGGIDFGVTF